MMMLTNTKQQKGERVIDYINRWRALSLNYKDRLTELSAVEMCTQGMHWGLFYILQGIKPRTFEELATRAHDIELSIASRGTKGFSVLEVRKDKKETNDAKKIVKSTIKESMVVNMTPLKYCRHAITTTREAADPAARINGGPHVKTGSSIDTKKKESTSRALVWRRIKHTNVENCHGKEFSCETRGEGEIRSNVPSLVKRKTFVTLNTSQGSLKVKRHDVILTNSENEGSEEGEGETSCHYITIIEESKIETLEEDAKDVP
ncbi:ty3-gypsy retrotransposon protein [Cucumis melo var. makuwa]|uniref:Ty3-gypsy retrotransposon protein n=1 Tax=Cucumis melo var. makuwa TaxID=1194695 RepID=A0A5D3BQ82_CUCMM|nr:ty3-gypsy retrotransposon protein [Cucumis melo var. makuwa]